MVFVNRSIIEDMVENRLSASCGVSFVYLGVGLQEYLAESYVSSIWLWKYYSLHIHAAFSTYCLNLLSICSYLFNCNENVIPNISIFNYKKVYPHTFIFSPNKTRHYSNRPWSFSIQFLNLGLDLKCLLLSVK